MKHSRTSVLALNTGQSQIGASLQFLRLIWAIDHSLCVSSKKMHKTLGITGPQRLVLRFVGLFPGVTPGRLARLLCLHPGTLTVILRGLEKRRLVDRTLNPEDGRSSQFRLSAKGRRFEENSPGTIEYVVDRVLARFPEAKIAAVKSVLGTLAQALKEDAEP